MEDRENISNNFTEDFTENMLEVDESMTPEYFSEESSEQTGEEAEQSAQAQPPAQPSAQQPEPPLYTDEEALRILESGGELDARRLTPTQKLIQKAFESHTTKRWQELAELKRAYESKLEEASRPKNIYEAFEADPVGVKRTLNELLIQKESEDPYSEDTIKLKKLKADLEVYETQLREYNKAVSSISNQNLTLIRNEIPDFNDKKAEELTNFAINELGLTNDEVLYLTDHRHGALAAKLTIVINKLYERLNATKSAEKKVVKPQPPTLGRAGSGEPESLNINSLKSRAERTGTLDDWAKYITAKTKINKEVR